MASETDSVPHPHQAGKLPEGKEAHKPSEPTSEAHEEKKPAGGFDNTPVPRAPPGYTLKFTFHRAHNLPRADFNSLSSDPYILATLKLDLLKRHKEDPDLTFRTPTIRKNTNPEWNCDWIVAHVPASGFFLKCRLFDEDPADHDDRLGNVHVRCDGISPQWPGIHEQPYKIKKRMGSKRAYLLRTCAALVSREVHMSGDVFISVECLGRSEGEGGRAYTIGPDYWTKHFSPLIGRLTGVTAGDSSDVQEGKKVKKFNFQANQIQLRGPVPASLYHRYVEFRPFVAGMFTGHTFKGRILNHALHHQHRRIYQYDRSTVYGMIPAPSEELTEQFLDLVHYAEGGRVFTYVLTLDAQWRFTETGKEFGIDLLSKHTMHSDVSIYIAYSGEFFIRLKRHHPSSSEHSTPSLLQSPEGSSSLEPHDHSKIDKNPAHYELFIDNDSGTYRPNAKYLPALKEFLSSNLPGLKIHVLDCQADAERMAKLKGEQREIKKHTGQVMTYLQGSISSDSLSSSDEEDLDRRAKEAAPEAKVVKGVQNIKNPKAKMMKYVEKQTAGGFQDGVTEGQPLNNGNGVTTDPTEPEKTEPKKEKGPANP